MATTGHPLNQGQTRENIMKKQDNWGRFPKGMTQLLDDKELRVFTILCGYADFKTGEAYPSQRRIATEAGMSRDGVQKALYSLVATGAIEELSRGYNVAGERTENTHYLIKDRANVLTTCGITEEQVAAIKPTDVAWGMKALADVDVPIVCPSEATMSATKRGDSSTYDIVINLLLNRVLGGVAVPEQSGVAVPEQSGVAVLEQSGVAVPEQALTHHRTYQATAHITDQITDGDLGEAATEKTNTVLSRGVESTTRSVSDEGVNSDESIAKLESYLSNRDVALMEVVKGGYASEDAAIDVNYGVPLKTLKPLPDSLLYGLEYHRIAVA